MNTLGTVLTSVTAAVATSMAIFLGLLIFPDKARRVPFLETPQADLKNAGTIYVDSPEIYTRERLVNDRYQQDAWLRRRLELSDSLDFGIQGVRDIRDMSKTIMQAKFGAAIGPDVADNPPLSEQEAPNPDTPTSNRDNQSSDNDFDRLKAPDSEDRSPVDDFRDRLSYREEVRSTIIENQLDDRHDLDGNTLYRLKFDATIVPAHRNTHWARIEVRVRQTLNEISLADYPKTAPMKERMRHLQQQWFDQNPAEVLNWHQVYDRYLEGLSQAYNAEFSERVAAVREVIEGHAALERPPSQASQDFQLLQDHLQQVLKTVPKVFRDEFDPAADTDKIMGEILAQRRTCQLRSDDTSIAIGIGDVSAPPNANPLNFQNAKLVSCMIRAAARTVSRQLRTGRWSRAEIMDRLIAAGLSANFELSNTLRQNGSSSRAQSDASRIERIVLSDDLRSLVRTKAYEHQEVLFDTSTDGDQASPPLTFSQIDGWMHVICKDENPTVFSEIGQKLESYGLQLGNGNWRTSPFFRLESPYLEVDPQSGAVRCFADYLHLIRIEGFVSFLEHFMGEFGQSAHSYAVTPKESVQRLSDSFDQAQASSALIAASIAATTLDAEAAAARLEQLQSGFSGISRFPLVVGFSQQQNSTSTPEEGYDVSFGWIVGPRFRPGQDGGPPRFHQVLTQQSLSALVSVPAWWPSLDLEIITSWMNMETGDIHENQRQRYNDVRLPGDVQETERILYPVLDKRPKIYKKRMEVTSIYSPASASPGDKNTADRVPIIIPGKNLWRSTVVTLGAERAQEIWVMPNMEGIIAQFDRAGLMRNAASDRPLLRVWTSEGMDDVRGRVRIVSALPSPEGRIQYHEPPGDDRAPSENVASDPAEQSSSDQQLADTQRTTDQQTTSLAQSAPPPPPSSSPESDDAPQEVTADPDTETVHAAKLLERLSEEFKLADPLLREIDRNPEPENIERAKGRIGDLQDTAEKLYTLESDDDTLKAVIESAQAIIESAQAIEEILNQIDDSDLSPAADSETQEILEEKVSKLANQIDILNLGAQREELKRKMAQVSVDAKGDIASAVIQRDGNVKLRSLRILGLGELENRDLDLRLGLIPDTLDEDPLPSHFTVDIDSWKDLVSGGALELKDIEVPVLDQIENGSFVSLVVQIADIESRQSELVRSEKLVFYSDKGRANIRAEGPDIQLNTELKANFSVTLPARTFYAYPLSGSNWVIARASVNIEGYDVDLRPEIFPLTDLSEEDFKLKQELTLGMAMDLSGSDKDLLKKHLDKFKRIPVRLSFFLDQPGEVPKIENNLYIVDIEEEPRS